MSSVNTEKLINKKLKAQVGRGTPHPTTELNYETSLVATVDSD